MLFGSGLDFLLANKNGWLPLLDGSARGLDFGTLLPDNRSIFGADADKFGPSALSASACACLSCRRRALQARSLTTSEIKSRTPAKLSAEIGAGTAGCTVS
ncbi:MAG: hypothetical protein WBZ51_15380 [Xanthobacteraceae bacterium]